MKVSDLMKVLEKIIDDHGDSSVKIWEQNYYGDYELNEVSEVEYQHHNQAIILSSDV